MRSTRLLITLITATTAVLSAGPVSAADAAHARTGCRGTGDMRAQVRVHFATLDHGDQKVRTVRYRITGADPAYRASVTWRDRTVEGPLRVHRRDARQDGAWHVLTRSDYRRADPQGSVVVEFGTPPTWGAACLTTTPV